MDETSAGLGATDGRSAELADRVRVPLWYAALIGIGYMGTGAGPVLIDAYRLGLLGFFVQTLGMVIVLSPGFVLPKMSGADLTRMSFPSTRRMRPWLFAAFIGPIALTLGLSFAGMLWAAFSVLLIGALTASFALVRFYGAMAADIRCGRTIIC